MTAMETVHHVRDFHVTLLRLMGLDGNRLTHYHAGRFKQLSQFGSSVIDELIALQASADLPRKRNGDSTNTGSMSEPVR
jgi:hypothetical protein